MTLYEALQTMFAAGYTQVRDDYSHRPHDIHEWLKQARRDLNDYTPDVETGRIVQNHDRPCNHFVCS